MWTDAVIGPSWLVGNQLGRSISETGASYGPCTLAPRRWRLSRAPALR
jgi:hypothetical protein